MARRRAPADMRTPDLFTGKTKLQEIEDMVREEEHFASNDTRVRIPVGEGQQECAIRWLGLDKWHVGDDVKIAVHPQGHAVLMLVRCTNENEPYSTMEVKLTGKQWAKLRELVLEGDSHGDSIEEAQAEEPGPA